MKIQEIPNRRYLSFVFCLLFFFISCKEDVKNNDVEFFIGLDGSTNYKFTVNSNKFDSICIYNTKIGHPFDIVCYKDSAYKDKGYSFRYDTIDGLFIMSYSLLESPFEGTVNGIKRYYTYEGELLTETFSIEGDVKSIIRRMAFTSTDQEVFLIKDKNENRVGQHLVSTEEMPVDTNAIFYFIDYPKYVIVGIPFYVTLEITKKTEHFSPYYVHQSDTLYFNENHQLKFKLIAEKKGRFLFYDSIEFKKSYSYLDYDRIHSMTFYLETKALSSINYTLPYREERNNYLYKIDSIPVVNALLRFDSITIKEAIYGNASNKW